MSSITTKQTNPEVKYVIKQKPANQFRFPLVPIMLCVVICLNIYSLSNENKIINILNTHTNALSSLSLQIQGVYTAYSEMKENLLQDLDQKIAKQFKKIAYGEYIKRSKKKKTLKSVVIAPKVIKNDIATPAESPRSQVAVEEQINDIENRELEIMNTVFNAPTEKKQESVNSVKDSFKKAHQLYTPRVIHDEE
jgi:hypothetical protein